MLKVVTVHVPFQQTVLLTQENQITRVLFDDVGAIEIGGNPNLSNPDKRVSAARLLNTAGELIIPAGEALYGYQGTNPTHNHMIKMLVMSAS